MTYPTTDTESSAPYAVTVRNLTRCFGDFVAVDNVSFDVKQGEIFGFLGANGAGKTTTIRMLIGLLKPSSGEGSVGGWDINQEYEKIKPDIGYMSQKFSLYDDLKVKENLFFFGGIYGLSNVEVKKRVTQLDTALNLSKREKTTHYMDEAEYCHRISIMYQGRIVEIDSPAAIKKKYNMTSIEDIFIHLVDR